MALDLSTVFIDDGGVLNDNARRAPEWRRLLGEYLPPRLGGTPEAWADANASVFERSWARYMERMRSGSYRGIEAWMKADRAQWLVEMCELVGVAPPDDPAAYAIEVGTWVSERVRSAIPGAAEIVRWLASGGMTLHMASGGLSWELAPYLRAMGILPCFDRLYGPDLVDTTKNGPHFYEALLADSHADPRTSAVVEDSAEVRGWAESVGLRAYRSLDELREALSADSR